jgi:hypothetical protein
VLPDLLGLLNRAPRPFSCSWVQFESAKHSYIDDLELALTTDGKVAVRSASRLGYGDEGVNGKRLNALAAAIRRVAPQPPVMLMALAFPAFMFATIRPHLLRALLPRADSERAAAARQRQGRLEGHADHGCYAPRIHGAPDSWVRLARPWGVPY